MAATLGFTLNAETLGSMTEMFSGTVGGSTRVFDQEHMDIEYRLSAASTADLYVRGFTPAEFAEVRLYNGGSGGDCLFGGHAVETSFGPIARLGDDPWWHLRCQDYTWLLNRYSRVRGEFSGVGVNTCLTHILADFTDGGFRVGYCPDTLGDVQDLVFEDVSVTDALSRLAEQVDAFWHVDADKRVHIFADPDHLSFDEITLDGTTKNFAALSLARDGQDIATKVVVHGARTQTTTRIGPNETYIPVDDVAAFVGDGSGGVVFVYGQRVAYTGTSVASGAGNLTGVTITLDIPQGAEVLVRGEAEDATAQSDLATLLGGGASGVAEIVVKAEQANTTEANALAAAVLERRKTSFTKIDYRAYDQQHTDAQATVPGQVVTVDITAPLTVSGDYRVQAVSLSVRTKVSGSTLGFVRSVTLAPYQRSLAFENAIQGRWRMH